MTTSAIECGSISFPLASVIVPVYNEGQAVAANISRLYDHIASIEPLTTWELIIVDDGSVDDTLLRVERFAKGYDNVRVVRHERNRGVGAAMKSGIDKARGSCVVVVDSDLSYDPRTVTRLIAEQRRSRAALVLASPYMAGGGTRNVPIIRLYMSLWANRLLSLANGGRIKTFTGMVRAYDRAFLSTLAWPESGNANVGLLLAARRAGAEIVEIPAELAWPPDRGAARLSFRRAAREVAAVLRYSADFLSIRNK